MLRRCPEHVNFRLDGRGNFDNIDFEHLEENSIMDLEKIIELAKILAKPYKITTYILAVLLILSLSANIYLATQEVEIVVDNNAVFTDSDNNNNEVRGK